MENKIDSLVEKIRELSPDEIRARLSHLDSEQRALRVLLRSRLDADRPLGLSQSSTEEVVK